MTDTTDRSFAAVETLRLALDSLGDALARVDLAGVLGAEPRVSAALHDLSSGQVQPLSPDARTEVLRARATLARCRRLGGAFDQWARIGLTGLGAHAPYDRLGRGRTTELPTHGLRTRV